MYVELTEQERLDIENKLLYDMAARYARLIEAEKAEMAAESRRKIAEAKEAAKRMESRKPETARIMMTRDGALSHQRKGLILDARVGECRGKTIYWIHWAGNSLAVEESDCVRLDERGTPIPK